MTSSVAPEAGGVAPASPRTPRRLGRPPGVDGEDTVRRILEVAERQFASVGYATATNKTISDECGLSTAAIHHHIGTKLALYVAVSDNVFPSMIEAYRAALRDMSGFRTQFATMLDVSIKLNDERPSLAGFVMGAPVEARRHPELREIVNRHFGQLERLMADLVDAAKATGEITSDLATDDMVDMTLSIMHGFAHLAYRDESSDKHARVVQAFEWLLSGG